MPHHENVPMERPGYKNIDPVLQFTRFVDETRQSFKGQTGDGQEALYIPLVKLQEYWTIKRIQPVLNSNAPHLAAIPPSLIRSYFLRVFSTLVYTNQVHYLREFTEHNLQDHRFPSDKIPSAWPERAPVYRKMFDEFRREQWTFFPFVFESSHLANMSIPTSCILPITLEQRLKKGYTTTVWKIAINESCNSLYRDGEESLRRTNFVLKAYHGQRFLKYYHNEVRALSALHENRNDHIITYYGCFNQGDKYYLILEYADGGNLDTLFKENSPPRTRQGVEDFWRSVFNVLKGLHHVHQATAEEDSDGLRLIHGDLKPDNILLSNFDSNSNYSFCPKLADFGYSDLRLAAASRGDKLLDQRGNQTYCAPECSHHAKFLQRGPNRITSLPDIFSIGAVLSDAAIWLAWGQKGRVEYFNLRVGATQAMKDFDGSGYEGCFHNGVERLAVVTEQHNKVLDTLRDVLPSDNITDKVIRLVEDHMLQRDDGFNRWNARELLLAFEQILQNAGMQSNAHISTISVPLVSRPAQEPTSPTSTEKTSSVTSKKRPWSVASTESSPNLAYSSPESPPAAEIQPYSMAIPWDTAEPTSKRLSPGPVPITAASAMSRVISTGNERGGPEANLNERPTQSRPRPGLGRLLSSHYLSLQQATEYREAKMAGRTVDPEVDFLMRKLETNLRGRDHYFFIDDSLTMKEHSSSIEGAFETLAFMANSIDSNSIELSFASSPSVRHSHRHTESLASIVKQHEYLHDGLLMEANLTNLVDNVLIPRLPKRILGHNWGGNAPISIFVFTDGRWGMPNDHSPGSGVDEPVRRLMNEILERRITRTKVMIQFVRFGDDEDGKRRLEYLDNIGRDTCDVVDTRSINGNVYAMFIGSIGRAHDDEPDE